MVIDGIFSTLCKVDRWKDNTMKKSILMVILTILVYGSYFPQVKATIINVPADQPTIQAGINAASDGDTVLVEQLTLSVDANDATVTDILINELGSALDTDTNNVYLYLNSSKK